MVFNIFNTIKVMFLTNLLFFMFSINKRHLLICLVVISDMFLSSCQTAQKQSDMNDSLEFYKPIVSKNGSDVLLEKDRQDCLEIVRIAKTKSDKSTITVFRGCLIDKGYRLVS